MAAVEVALAALKAVEPPLIVVSTLAPAVPEDWSHARNATEAVGPFRIPGTKRNMSVARNSNAELSETDPTAFQVVPPLSEYCQRPVLLLSPVTAIPCGALWSASVTLPEIRLE